ncbi:unnamed protein product [Nippostrongylus brasiliensis]|uniref:CHHC U11-48K-type domain-containing protein n=1 Tax=Nippostrongylus brasiliensis TaxID=27835 RepID=A0A0N4YVR9_NIPBR|nr:hypothetical protein Q1695_013628 [Nippostrongylus brasiliensis]VDL85088.1 unnamed protein product [Nippostrongylus brasiliensis]
MAEQSAQTSPTGSQMPTLEKALVTCPYNLNHRVEPELFPDHLCECRQRYCRANGQNLKLVRCKVNSRHFLPEVEIAFHEHECEDYTYRQIMDELKTEPIPIKVPSSDSSDKEDNDSTKSDTSVSSGDTEYSTSKEDLLRRILKGPDDNYY